MTKQLELKMHPLAGPLSPAMSTSAWQQDGVEEEQVRGASQARLVLIGGC
jgi:hypothetical protein